MASPVSYKKMDGRPDNNHDIRSNNILFYFVINYILSSMQWCALEASNNPSLELEVPMESFGRPLEASNHHSN